MITPYDDHSNTMINTCAVGGLWFDDMIILLSDDHPHCYLLAWWWSTPNWCPLMIWWSSSYDQMIIPELQVGDARHHLVGGRRRHLVRHWPDRKIDVEQEFIDFWARHGYVSSAVKQVTSDSWHLIPGTPSSKVCFTVESCKNVLKRPPSKRYPSLNSFQLVSKQTVFFAPFDIALVTPSKFRCFDFVYASNQHMFPYLGPWNCLIAK